MLKFSAVLAFVAVLVCSVLLSFIDAARPKWHQLEGYTFEQYMSDFGKRYQPGTSEHKMRKHIFVSSVEKIKKHNADDSQSWKMGVNMFTDMTKSEWKKFQGFKKSATRPAPNAVLSGYETAPQGWVPPKNVDWRERGLGEPVKHQGSCGCCWSNSGTESMEDYYYLLTGKKPVLSFQQMASCTPAPLSYGCGGGDYAEGWSAIKTSGVPLTEEWAYPFTDFFFPTTGTHPTAACYNISSKFPNKTPYNWFAELTQVGINGYNSIQVNNATAAKAALAMIGTQSISIAAGNWQWYEEGIFQNTPKNGEDDEWSIDHAVQAVGYGVQTTVVNGKRVEAGYWLVRNSWSSQWGENGYIRLWRALESEGQTEPCSPQKYGPVCGTSGILSDLQYPLVKDVTPLPF